MSRPTLELIPWDAESLEHADRLIEQRIACGWHADKVDGPWKEAQRNGSKCIYWLVIPKNSPDYEPRMEAHNASFPKQATLLVDTAARVGDSPRDPTKQSFSPVGHIALDMGFPGADYLNLDMPTSGVIWIKTLYISHPLQSLGLGRAAMDALEAMATEEPLCATTLMLDTMSKNDQLREDFAMVAYGYIPKIANEAWYSRRGYRVVKTVPGFYSEVHPEWQYSVSTVFMRRDLG